MSIMIGDDLSEEMNVEDSLPVNTIVGEVLEVKSQTNLSKAINECFYNMFSAGCKLTCIALSRGRIVAKNICTA